MRTLEKQVLKYGYLSVYLVAVICAAMLVEVLTTMIH